MLAMLPFGILGAAVFAKPAVAKIEEMRGLVHSRISDFLRSQISKPLEEPLNISTEPELRLEIQEFTSIYLSSRIRRFH
jgi:hypothetical protein